MVGTSHPTFYTPLLESVFAENCFLYFFLCLDVWGFHLFSSLVPFAPRESSPRTRLCQITIGETIGLGETVRFLLQRP